MELAAYQLKDIAQIWHKQWKEARPVKAVPIVWELFMLTLLDSFSPENGGRLRWKSLLTLMQGRMSVKEYALKFTQLSQYVPSMV